MKSDRRARTPLLQHPVSKWVSSRMLGVVLAVLLACAYVRLVGGSLELNVEELQRFGRNFGVTFGLMVLAMAIILPLCGLIGYYCAGSAGRRWLLFLATVLSSLPVFVLGWALQSRTDVAALGAVATLVLSGGIIAGVSREYYWAFVQEFREPHYRTAVLFGNSRWSYGWQRMLLTTLVTAKNWVPIIMGATVVVETCFPMRRGLGARIKDAVDYGDYGFIFLALLGGLVVVLVLDACMCVALGRWYRNYQKSGVSSPLWLVRAPGPTLGKVKISLERGSGRQLVSHARAVCRNWRYYLGLDWALSAFNRVLWVPVLLCLLGTVVILFEGCGVANLGIRRVVSEASLGGLARLFGALNGEVVWDIFRKGAWYYGPWLVCCCIIPVSLLGVCLGTVSAVWRGKALGAILDAILYDWDALPKFFLVIFVVQGLTDIRVASEIGDTGVWPVPLFSGTGRVYAAFFVSALCFLPSIAFVVKERIEHLSDRGFVASQYSLGGSKVWIMLYHILWSNCLGIVVIRAVQIYGGVLVLNLTLGYLRAPGFGIKEDWGSLIYLTSQRFFGAAVAQPWVLLVPALATSLVVCGITLFGDVLRLADGEMRH